MTEPDVALTDYLIALESAVFAVWLWRQTRAPQDSAGLFALFFATAGLSALAGGTVHGFLPDTSSALGRALWRVSLVALGLTAACTWAIGARLLLSDTAARRVLVAAAVEWILYVVVIVAVSDRFSIAVANYLPATLFLMAALAASYRVDGHASIGLGLLGLSLTLVAAAIQRFQVALHRVHLSHNALYHLVQALALLLIFRSAQHLSHSQIR